MVNSIRTLLLIGLLLQSPAILAAQISVSVDRNPVALNESFQLVYLARESVDDDPDFSPLEDVLDIVNRSQSSNISYINGEYNNSKTWTLTVMAKRVGSFELPAISFGSDVSDHLKLTVTEASQPSQQQSGFFSRLKVDQESLYSQQQLVITQQMLSDQNISAFAMGELEFNLDVVVEPLSDETKYQTQINGKPYLVIEKRFAVFPQQAGSLNISPALAEARLGNSRLSLFDAFPNRGKIVRARSNAAEIEVRDIPANAGVNPWLPASELSLNEQWQDETPRFVQGEPITRTLSVKAEGLTAAQIPVLPDIAINGLKQYPDQPLLNDVRNGDGMTGYRVEKVALVPTRPGKLVLPAIRIPWWNTRTGQREEAVIPSRTIEVVAAVPTTNSAPIQPVPVLPETVQSEQQGPAITVEAINEKPSQNWMWLAAFLGLGWALTILGWIVSGVRGNPEKSSQPVENKSTSLKAHIKAVDKACRKQDRVQCRKALQAWARVFFGDTRLTLAESRADLPAELAEQITRLDASLYSTVSSEVDLKLIIAQVRRQSEQSWQSPADNSSTLEPLYR